MTIYKKIKCKHCRTSFTPSFFKRKFCSPDCREKYYKKYRKKWKKNNPEKIKIIHNKYIKSEKGKIARKKALKKYKKKLDI